MSNDAVLRVEVSLKGKSIKSKLFSKGAISIGRDTSSDICLDNPGVSREHARIARQPNGSYRVEDLGSTNGTFVDGKRIGSPMDLPKGSTTIVVGKFSVSIENQSVDQESTLAASGMESFPADGTALLTRDQLARVMESVEQPDHNPDLKLVTAAADAPSDVRQGWVLSPRALFWIAITVVVGVAAVLFLVR